MQREIRSAKREGEIMYVYEVYNKTGGMLFESKEDADKYAGSYGVAIGLQVSERFVLPTGCVVEKETK
jgi:hypothetical protein